ncbi:MAG: hypothetical protein JXB47_03670 [Anaerolineae bacterium]|nr:hypothetical protein [Anaerolineae bacterium]
MAESTLTHPKMLPRTVNRSMPLGGGGLCEVVILHPEHPEYADLAAALASVIAQRCGAPPEVLTDRDAMPSIGTPLPDRYRRRSLILLGDLNTNRALIPLYANYYCATDGTYPGGDGYELRTIVNPYGAGHNVILAGGSTLNGVRRAVERLVAHVNTLQGEAVLPFLLEVEPEPELARALAEWPEAPLDAQLPNVVDGIRKGIGFNEGLTRAIGAYGSMYWWTGDMRYGVFARDSLRMLNDLMTDSYGDWHYRAERILRVLPLLVGGGLLDDADIARTDALLLGTALGTQDMWWRMRSGDIPLGHRHHGKGTYEFYLLARYLRDQAIPNAAARVLCDRWVAECEAFLDALARACIDDQDDETVLNNMATPFWYALGAERFAFFESGNAQHVALRAIALHDNMGAGCGQGGYGEGLAGAMYLQHEATVMVAVCAFYYQDGRFKWILERMPHLKAPLRGGFLSYSPPFIRGFDTGPGLLPAEPEGLAGLQALPLTLHQYAINTNPPEHIEPLGHSVNAPETWLMPEGVGVNKLPRAHGIDKIVIRGGFAPGDVYLLLQGYQGGYRFQGHMKAANCIVRFAQEGHIFLHQNTSRHLHYHKNGVSVSDGYNDTPMPPIAEWLAADDFARVGLGATRLSDYHHTDWDRCVFWSKAGKGFFVVIDAVRTQAAGPYSFNCTWRTPGYAELDGRTWRARQGRYRFTLRCSEALDATSEEEQDQGGSVPYVLRQRKEGDFEPGDQVVFQNVFYVRPQTAPEAIDLLRLDARAALVTQDGAPLAWCGVAGPDGQELHAPGLTLHAAAAWVTKDEIALAGARRLHLDNGDFESNAPVGLCIDLAGAALTVQVDGPAETPIPVRVTVGGVLTEAAVTGAEPMTIALPAGWCAAVSASLHEALGALRPFEAGDAPAAADWPGDVWRPVWTFDSGERLPERVRDVTVEAVPAPLDGFTEQLIDATLPDVRDAWQQWPAAPEYQITLTFPDARAIDHLRIVGDSIEDPTLRTFSPLPGDISVALSSDGFRDDLRRCPAQPETGVLRWKRYRDMEDRMETRDVIIGQRARQARLHVPAPPEGRPLVLHEIEVYGAGRVAPPVRHLVTADIDGDGRPEVLIADATNALIVLDDAGSIRWRQRLPGPVTHLSCLDLDGDGRQWICLGILGGELRFLSAEGALRQTIPLALRFRQLTDVYFGWFNTVHAVVVWHRAPDGRAALMVGGYGVNVFLDPDGQIIGHTWADGPWQTDVVTVAQGEGGPCDLWVRNGWNHGILLYEGKQGLAPSGATVVFGGVQQPMFRALRRVIPFVNGKTAAFQLLRDGQNQNILAAAELGVGVLSTAKREWVWKIEGGASITACVADEDHGQAVIGSADGFVAAFALSDGRPVRRLRTGAPVVGLATLPSARILAVATRRGVLALTLAPGGEAWQVRGFYPVAAQKLSRLGEDGVLVVRDDGLLEALTFVERGG